MTKSTIIGLDKLEAKLKKLERPQKAMAKGLTNYHGRIEGQITRYAPPSAANFPPAPYYVRGRGTFTGRKNNNKSEKLSNKWKDFRVTPYGTGVRGTIENTASYAPYVVGDNQALFHKRRGWPQTQRIIDITKQMAVREIAKEIEKILKG